jgi:hypothetical protein
MRLLRRRRGSRHSRHSRTSRSSTAPRGIAAQTGGWPAWRRRSPSDSMVGGGGGGGAEAACPAGSGGGGGGGGRERIGSTSSTVCESPARSPCRRCGGRRPPCRSSPRARWRGGASSRRGPLRSRRPRCRRPGKPTVHRRAAPGCRCPLAVLPDSSVDSCVGVGHAEGHEGAAVVMTTSHLCARSSPIAATSAARTS